MTTNLVQEDLVRPKFPDISEISGNTIKIASIAVAIATIVARIAAHLTGLSEYVDDVTYGLLFVSTIVAIILLRFGRHSLAGWAFFVGTLLAMFNNSLLGAFGQSLSVIGYTIAMILAITVLPRQQWRFVTVFGVVAICASTFTSYQMPQSGWTSSGHLLFGILQLCFFFVAAIVVGYLYSNILQMLAAMRAAYDELEAVQTKRAVEAQNLFDTHQRLQLINDHVPVRIVYVDKDENITFRNRGFNRAYETATDVSALSTSDALRGDYEICKPYLARAFAGEVVDFEFEHAGHLAGNFSQVTYVPHKVNGVVEGLVVLATDVTQRRLAENALREKSDLLEMITNNLPARISYTAADGSLKFINKAFAKKFGFEPSNVPIPSSNRESALAKVTRWRNGQPQHAQRALAGEFVSFERETIEGGEVEISEVKLVPHKINGKVVGFTALALDISERKKSEQALREKSDLLELITSHLPAQIAYFDANENLRFYNQPFFDSHVKKWLPHDASQEEIMRFTDYAAPEARAKRQPHVDVVNTGKNATFELLETHFDPNGDYIHTVLVPHIEDGKVVGRVHLGTNVTDLRRTQQSLEKSLAIFDHVINNVPARISYLDAKNNIVFVNSRIETDFGLKVENVIDRNAIDIFPTDYYNKVTPHVLKAFSSKQKVVFDSPFTLPDGTQIIERSYLFPQFVNGEWDALFMLHMDVTNLKKTEASLNKAQKLESLGVLAGGIAHDFNNILVAMLGQSSLALAKTAENHPARRHIVQSVTASERAATLTQQMLAYSGRGSFAIGHIDLNDVINQNLKLFEVSIPKNIQLITRLSDNLPLIEADTAQIQQIIMNLIINAGQAIGEEQGRITILTTVENITDDHGEFWEITGDELIPGPYVSIQIQDDGVGMSAETKNKIFDPFYTTKDNGTGLGLAAALGIIRGHRGGIRLYSELGHGTIFHLLFPVSTDIEANEVGLDQSTNPTPLDTSHTVLVIDDEVAVVNAVADILEMKQIATIQATRGKDALRIYEQRQSEICLVLLDLMMPGMNGEEVFRALRDINPDVKIMLSSGYSRAEATRHFIGQNLADFIQKPYSFDTLASKVLEVLEPVTEPA